MGTHSARNYAIMINKDLTDYIVRQRENGANADNIKAALLAAGWSPEDANEGLRVTSKENSNKDNIVTKPLQKLEATRLGVQEVNINLPSASQVAPLSEKEAPLVAVKTAEPIAQTSDVSTPMREEAREPIPIILGSSHLGNHDTTPSKVLIPSANFLPKQEQLKGPEIAAVTVVMPKLPSEERHKKFARRTIVMIFISLVIVLVMAGFAYYQFAQNQNSVSVGATPAVRVP